MKKFTAVLAVALILALAAVIYLWPKSEGTWPCVITGDVEQEIVLTDLPADSYVKTPEGGRGLSLAALVETCRPFSEQFSVLLMASDGLIVQLKGDELEGCYIIKDNGSWKTQVSKHPVNANLDELVEIVVADESDGLAVGANVISKTGNLCHLTPGNAFRYSLVCYPYLLGNPQLKNGYAVSLFRQKQVLPLTAVAAEEIESLLVVGKDGESKVFVGDGYLELRNNEINFLQPENKMTQRNIAGVIVNPPAKSVRDAYQDALFHLDRGERVMVVLIDGLGYHQYEQAVAEGLVPNMGALEGERAYTVYKPVANAGLAAIVTGQLPGEQQTIFDVLEVQGKAHVLVEGSRAAPALNTKMVYSDDRYGDGSTDDDVFGDARAQVENNPDFLMVHFHGVDAAGRKHGPLARQTLDALADIDAYIGLLLKEWEGKVLILSGHGMHVAGPGGDHGCFQFEDMFVPYIKN